MAAAAALPGVGPNRRLTLGYLLGAAGVLTTTMFPRRAPAASPDFAAALARGVNLSHWFAQSYEGYGAEHFSGFVTDNDIARIAAADFTHVRLAIDPGILFEAEGKPRFVGPVLEALNRALDAVSRHDLAAVVDLHPVGDAKNPLLTRVGADAFVARWSLLASELAARPDGTLFLEILNEPDPLKGAAWWALQARALSAIRAARATHPVIVNGGGWSGIDDLVAQRPYADPRVVYTAHYYAPLLFTHQATDWAWDVAEKVGGLDWPLDPQDAVSAARKATDDPEAREILQNAITDGTFTRQAMQTQFQTLARWREAVGSVPVYIGEFGVYTARAPFAARLDWVSSARRGFEQRGWGWALWDHSAEFGFLEPNSARLDPAMERALGVGS